MAPVISDHYYGIYLMLTVYCVHPGHQGLASDLEQRPRGFSFHIP